MLQNRIELPPGEQKRILGVIDLTLENRRDNGKPENEKSYITLLWAIMAELRAFCGFLGVAIGDMEQVMEMERQALKHNISTPAILLFDLYRIVTSTKTERNVIMPPWLQEIIDEEEARTDGKAQTESGE